MSDNTVWSLTGNRKQNKMSDFWPKKWSLARVSETVFDLQAKRLFTKWSLTGGGHYERLDCTSTNIKKLPSTKIQTDKTNKISHK